MLKRSLIWTIFIVALLLRLVYVAFFADHWLFYDTIHYETAAHHIVDGKGFGPSLHYGNKYAQYCLEPIYPIFMALIYTLFGMNTILLRISQVLLSLLQIYLLYDLAKCFVSKRVQLYVLLFSSIYPFYIMIAGLAYPSQLFCTLLVALVWALHQYQLYARPRHLVLAGVLYGLALQTGPVLMPSIPLVLFWLWRFRKQGRNAITVFLGCTILTVAPWTLRNYYIFHKFAPGRACMEEQRFVDSFYYALQDKKMFKQPVFSGRKIGVSFDNREGHTWADCYLDGQKLVTLKIVDGLLPVDSLNYLGVFFEGKTTNRVERIEAFRTDSGATSNNSLPCWTSADSMPSIATAGMVHIKPAVALQQASDNGWANKLIWQKPVRANYFEYILPDSISPQVLRRMAMLFYLNRPDVSADGYMFWLQPCLEFDLWHFQSGAPLRPVGMEKKYWTRESISVLKVLWREPKSFLWDHYLLEFLNFWSPVVSKISTASMQPSRMMQVISLVFFLPLLIFTPIGMYLHREQKELLWLSLIFIFTIACGYSLFSSEVRYRIPVDGFLILWSAAGIARLLQGKVKKQPRSE